MNHLNPLGPVDVVALVVVISLIFLSLVYLFICEMHSKSCYIIAKINTWRNCKFEQCAANGPKNRSLRLVILLGRANGKPAGSPTAICL